jgi:hypothetical protein
MPIEILILSGARRGEQLNFDKDRISIGHQRPSDVHFSPRKHPGADGKQAELLLDDYGWRLHNVGEGDWYLNQTILPVSGAAPLRSGDVVRISEVGPDFRFTILPSPKPAAHKPRQARPLDDQETEAMTPLEPAAEQTPAPRLGGLANFWPAVAVAVLAFLAVLVGLNALRYSGQSARPMTVPQENAPAVERPETTDD